LAANMLQRLGRSSFANRPLPRPRNSCTIQRTARPNRRHPMRLRP
jgi:hypothetical protein